MVGAYAMGFATLLSFPYLQKMVGGSDAHQYAVIGAMLGVVAAVMTLICGLLTKERLKPKRAEKAISGSLIALFLGWSQYDNRQDGKYSHRSYFHHRLCAYDGLVALLSLPCCYCLLADGIVV